MRFFSKQTTLSGFGAACFLLCMVNLSAIAEEPPANKENPVDSSPVDGLSDERTEDDAANEAEAKAQIRKALQGAGGENEQQKSVRDPLLDDVLQMLRRQGSLLDGTVLDPKLNETAERAEPAGSGPSARPNRPAAFRTAETLLRSARLLEALPGQDAARQQLIQRMRGEASRCLRQALSQSVAAPPETR